MANYTKEEQFELIRKDFSKLRFIDNQDEEVCLEAIKKNAYAIIYIKNPTEEMKLEVIKKNGFVINSIKNPTEEMKLEAVKSNGLSIEYIENPTEEMKWEAIKQSGLAIEYIKNPTEEMKLEAVKQYGTLIRHIEKPTQEIKLEAVKDNGFAIEYIEDVNYEICFAAVSSIVRSFLNSECDCNDLKIENAIFLISNLDLKGYIDDYYDGCSELYLNMPDKSADNEILVISMDVFNKLKDYLLNFNKGNSFIFDNSVDMQIIKDAIVSNNEVMYINYNDMEQMPNQYKTLFNKIISVDDLLKID